MFGFSRKTQTENPSEHLVKLASVSKDTISSKVSAFLKYRIFSLVPILFAALLFVGCGGGSGGESGYTVSFYSADLKLLSTERGRVDLGIKAYEHRVTSWYKSGETNATFGYFTPTADTKFFAVADVEEVTDATQLYDIRSSTPSSDKFILGSDISVDVGPLNPRGWTPIPILTGTFEGNGHTIRGVWINDNTGNNVGLFEEVNGGTVRNLNIELDERGINGTGNVGAIAGKITGSAVIDNITVTGNVNGTGGNVGAIAGQINGNSLIANVTIEGDVGGEDYVGGIAGFVTGGAVIADVTINGDVSGTGDNVGGIAGYATDSTITNSSSTGNVNGEGNNVGGIVGDIGSGSTITNSSSAGNVNGESNNVGGIAGNVVNGDITNSSSTGNISGSSNVGGIAGNVMSGSIITGSHSEGTISGVLDVHGAGNEVGGIVGRLTGDAKITKSSSTGVINGVSSIGGIAGLVEYGGEITNSYFAGNINGTGQNVGGIAGVVWDEDSIIINSYSAGVIIGGSYVGGIAGSVEEYGEISNSYSNASVEALSDNVGGIAGHSNQLAKVKNNAAINPLVVGTALINRVIGSGGGTAGNIATNTLTGTFTDGGVLSYEGRLTDADEFKLKATYDENGLGWDFDDIWDIDNGNGYPYLKWQNP